MYRCLLLRNRAVRAALPIAFVACAAAGNARSGAERSGTNMQSTSTSEPSRSEPDAGVHAIDARAADARADAGMEVQQPQVEMPARPCSDDMALIHGVFCIDRYEGSLVELMPDGSTTAFASNLTPEGHDVRAVSQAGVLPQGYISAVQAEDACVAAGKRLCELEEWQAACRGPANTDYPYGAAREVGRCNDNGQSAVGAVFPDLLRAAASAPRPPARAAGRPARKGKPKPGAKRPTAHGAHRAGPQSAPPMALSAAWSKLNDPALGLVPGTLTRCGERERCVGPFGVYDLVGNRHEWVADTTDSGNGIFAGGYFSDVEQNGAGCNYRTEAHATSYHDYSTGFRCCRDVEVEGDVPLATPK